MLLWPVKTISNPRTISLKRIFFLCTQVGFLGHFFFILIKILYEYKPFIVIVDYKPVLKSFLKHIFKKYMF